MTTVQNLSVKTKPRKAYGGVLAGLCLGLLGLGGSRLGHLWIAFDVFSQFTLQFAIVIFAFVVGFVLPKWKVLGALVIMMALLAGVSAWPFLATQHPRVLSGVAVGERELKVATFNTFYNNQNAEAVVREVSRINADIVTLVELSPDKYIIFDALKKQYPYNAQCPKNEDACDFGILSKYPLSNIVNKSLYEGPPHMQASLGPDFGGLTVFGVHTTRFPHFRAQYKQLKKLASELDAMPGPHLVMGDFNATPYSRVLQDFATSADLQRFTNLPTWPARLSLPQIAIDHVFASKGIRQLETQGIGNNVGSDHFPIFLKIAVPVK